VADRAAPLPLWWPAVPVRNALFAAIVLATGVRRLFPPYGAEGSGETNTTFCG